MPKYRCNNPECKIIVDGMFIVCPECGAMGKGSTEVDVAEEGGAVAGTETAEEARRAAEERRAAEQARAEEEARRAAEERRAAEQARAEEEARRAAEERRAAEQARAEEEARRAAEERRAAEKPDRLIWRYPPVDSREAKGPSRGCPAVDSEGHVFVCLQNQLLMFAPGDCSPKWKYDTGGFIPRSPAIGPDGNVRVHSADGCLHVVDPNGQAVFPPVAVGEPLGWASPLVDQQNNTWICRHEGGLAKVDARGKTSQRPFFRTRRRFDCTGLICGDTLYIGCEDHFMYAVPLTGDRGKNAWAGQPELGRTGCAIHCPLAMTNTGTEILVGSQDDQLYSFGLDGRKRWAIPLPGHLLGSPVVHKDGTIYVGVSQNPRDSDARGILIAVNGATHQIRWQYHADAPIECTSVLGDDGILYFGDNSGTIHAVDLNGTVIWKAEFDAPVRSAGAIIDKELVAFALDNGTLVALTCSSQRISPRGWPKLLGTPTQGGAVIRA